jgi:hypothetical protein
MRFPVPLVVELNDEQLAAWAKSAGIGQDGWVRAKNAVEGIRAHVLVAVQAHFDEMGVRADVSIKR